jgi:hypothetical protein
MSAAFTKFLGGSGGLLLGGGLAGVLLGLWLGGLMTNGQFQSLAERQARSADEVAGAMVVLVQNAGRREMNYLYRHEAERRQFAEAIETFRKWDELSAEARTAALARNARLTAEQRALSAKYEELVKSYESADASVTGWLRAGLPPDLCIVRYGAEACRADPFAAAGYPAPPDRAGAVAEPPR